MILGEKVPEMLIRRFHKNQSYCRSYTPYNDDALPFHQSLLNRRRQVLENGRVITLVPEIQLKLLKRAL